MSGGLFVSDIDGTLVTPDKQLAPAALAAAAGLAAARVPFTVVSSRPPRGMAAVVKALGVKLPFAAFNGGSIVSPDMTVLEAHRLHREAASAALALLGAGGIDAWVFADDAWLARDPYGRKTDLERRTVGFEPTPVSDFGGVLDRIDKIVAVSDDRAALDAAEAELRVALGPDANIERSQTYYLDITDPQANKGDALRRLAARVGADLSATVVIGDMPNDIAMFRVAGFAIAMGQSPPSVKGAADAVTAADTEDGFAKAVTGLVLPRFLAAKV